MKYMNILAENENVLNGFVMHLQILIKLIPCTELVLILL